MEQNNRGQAMFEQAGKQALKVLMSPEGSKSIAMHAKQAGPAKAIAEALNGVTSAIVASAKGAGVELPPEVIQATQTSIAQVLVAMMVESGLAQDPDALMQELAPMLGEGGEEGEEAAEPPGDEPADPAMDAAEDAAEGEMEDDGDEPKGALARMGRK